MSALLKLLFGITIVAIPYQMGAQVKFDCKTLRSVKLKYADTDVSSAYVSINGNKHVEYHNSGKYVIKSDLEWISDCEYNAKLTEVTLPGFPFGPGEIMNVKIERFEGAKIFGTGSVRGEKFPVEFEIVP